MNASTETPQGGSLDTVKWIVVFLLLGGAVYGNYYFGEESALFRALGVVGAVIVAGVIALQTDKGRNFFTFAKESRTEVRKVVWPTKQESMQTTGIVIVATLVMSLILWGLDSLLYEIVSFITSLQV
ncbi:MULTISPECIES: preprotein translocase subunit SecE [unclassified Thalassotalea]|uniref:preprotein translocase subunit SecE n=1 Tax=unclassified Thalassotalea TaxID=2614972 RepID=UPI001081724A|nr:MULTISPECIES: preprotein translocase subunit SecE [unclassified Thalassotalea]NMP17089.1 preprotein translocase subunit SecE [Thalassotalea sp. Y01]QBY03994.1 preprotein translocase subunit SecE [Thalassotalea sp. HSM 43]